MVTPRKGRSGEFSKGFMTLQSHYAAISISRLDTTKDSNMTPEDVEGLTTSTTFFCVLPFQLERRGRVLGETNNEHIHRLWISTMRLSSSVK